MSEINGAYYNQDTLYNQVSTDEGGTFNTLTYPDTHMTNEKLSNIIQLYRSNIFLFVFDNNKRIFLGYGSSPKMDDVSLITIGNTEFIKISNKKYSNQKEIKYFTLYGTAHLQSIGMMNDDFTKFGPDPLLFI